MGQSLPFAGHKIFGTSRDDEAANFLSSTLLPCRIERIADRQKFRLDMTGRHLKRTLVAFNQFAVDTLVTPGLVEDTVIVGVACDHRNPSFFEIDEARVQATPAVATIMSPTRRTRINRPRESGMFGVTLPGSVLSDQLEQISGRRIRGPMVLEPSIDLTRGPGRLFHEALLALRLELESQEPGRENDLRLAILEDALVSAVLYLPGNHMGLLEDQTSHVAAPWVVQRAEDYMAAHFADPITISDLVRLCNCSRTSLTDAFRSSRNYTAMAFLMARRLDAARNRLLTEPDATITEIALDCGFGNHGRFAKAYQAQFGELPSATHARRHGSLRP